jgi:hypothetical protein
VAIGEDGTAYVTYTDEGNDCKATIMIYRVLILVLLQIGTYTFVDQTQGYSSQ